MEYKVFNKVYLIAIGILIVVAGVLYFLLTASQSKVENLNKELGAATLALATANASLDAMRAAVLRQQNIINQVSDAFQQARIDLEKAEERANSTNTEIRETIRTNPSAAESRLNALDNEFLRCIEDAVNRRTSIVC